MGQGYLIDDLVATLYEDSFPIEERREWAEVLYLLHNNDAFSLKAIMLEEEEGQSFLGFISQWHLSESWLFIEHFALKPEFRSQGFGADIIKGIINSNTKKAIILECEPPTTALAERRIDFYHRLGFKIISTDYKQPSYRPNTLGRLSEDLPLYLLAKPLLPSEQLPKLISTIHTIVYARS